MYCNFWSLQALLVVITPCWCLVHFLFPKIKKKLVGESLWLLTSSWRNEDDSKGVLWVRTTPEEYIEWGRLLRSTVSQDDSWGVHWVRTTPEEYIEWGRLQRSTVSEDDSWGVQWVRTTPEEYSVWGRLLRSIVSEDDSWGVQWVLAYHFCKLVGVLWIAYV
jgi:hypothetical protein